MVARERELQGQFSSVKKALDAWGAWVDETILALVNPVFAGTNFLQVEPKHRCKDEASFINKALYRGKNNNYPNPIVNIEDKVATRIILLTTKNVETVKGLLTDCSEWYHKVSKDTKEFSRDNPNLFDYQSVHLVVWPKAIFCGIDNEVLTCEIQIRTLLEHAYAEVTHDSVYKGPYQNNSFIKRQLSKCMALMETTDDMFCKIFELISLKAENSEDAFTQLVIQATRIYNGVVDDVVSQKGQNLYLIDAILSVFQEKPITAELLTTYTTTHEQDIKIAIRTSGSILVREPAILILFCYIEYFEEFLYEHWPLSITILDSMKESLGISAGEY